MKYILYIIVFFCSIKALANDSPKDSNFRKSFCSSNIKVSGNSSYAEKLSKVPDVVYGFSIDGELSINQEDYFVRVLVKGKDGREYKVMESYKEIHGNIPTQFEDYGEETFITNGINLDSIKVYVHGANITINGIRFFPDIRAIGPSKDIEILANDKRDRIIKANVDKINEYNETHKLLWRAEITWLSQQSYETRKRILGIKDDCSTRGIEYYAGGIIEIDDTEQYDRSPIINTSYVDNFDWRKRHGKNWMTSVKHQGNSNCCFLFTCVGAVEAMTNLYYNQKIDLNLSEQELISCSGLNNPYSNGTSSDMMELPLNYLVNHGVCDEQSYQFVDLPNQTCMSLLITPNEQIKISGYDEVDITDENEIKKALINHGPLISGIRSVVWMNHSMVLVGYGILQAGDTIYHHLWYNHDTQTYVHDKILTVGEDDPRIGRTYMIYKSSYGVTDNDTNQGYMYVIHNNYSTSLNRTFYLTLPVTSLNYSEEDVVIEDADGDGYYFWGLGPKPANSPSWIPDEPDGDDSDYQYGPMDTYGNLENLGFWASHTLYMMRDTTYTSRSFLYTNICVTSSTRLTVKSILTLYGNTKITVRANGELVIDGGVLENANIELKPGGKIILENGGTIIMRDGKDFYAPVGAILTINEGQIK